MPKRINKPPILVDLGTHGAEGFSFETTENTAREYLLRNPGGVFVFVMEASNISHDTVAALEKAQIEAEGSILPSEAYNYAITIHEAEVQARSTSFSETERHFARLSRNHMIAELEMLNRLAIEFPRRVFLTAESRPVEADKLPSITNIAAELIRSIASLPIDTFRMRFRNDTILIGEKMAERRARTINTIRRWTGRGKTLALMKKFSGNGNVCLVGYRGGSAHRDIPETLERMGYDVLLHLDGGEGNILPIHEFLYKLSMDPQLQNMSQDEWDREMIRSLVGSILLVYGQPTDREAVLNGLELNIARTMATREGIDDVLAKMDAIRTRESPNIALIQFALTFGSI